ncbi:hypothetical protein AOLI_G00269190 [Acnodon oligacanthus]
MVCRLLLQQSGLRTPSNLRSPLNLQQTITSLPAFSMFMRHHLPGGKRQKAWETPGGEHVLLEAAGPPQVSPVLRDDQGILLN